MNLELDFDPQTVCRICLSPGDRLLNLFASTVVDGYLTAVPDMIHACLDLMVNPKDMMPGKLCNGCKTDITNFYVFRQKSQRTDRLLRSMMPSAVDQMKAEPKLYSAQPKALQPAASTHDHALMPVSLPTPPPHPQPIQVQHPVAPISQMIGCEFCDQSFPSECELSNHCMDKHATVDDELQPNKGRFAADLLDLPETTDLLSILTAEQPLDDGHVDDQDVDYDAQSSQAAEHDNESTTTIEVLMPAIVKPDSESDGGDDDEHVEELEEEHLDIADYEDNDEDASEAAHTAEPIYQCYHCPHSVCSTEELDEHLKLDHSLYRCALCSQTMRLRTLQKHQITCIGGVTMAIESSAVASTATTTDPEDELDTDSEMTMKSDDEYTLVNDFDNNEDDDCSYTTPDERRPARKRRKTVSSTTPTNYSAAPQAARKPRTAPFVETCQECDREFTNQNRFDRHQRMHQHMDVINAYVIFHPCHLCRSIYLKAADLRRHHCQEHGMDVGNEDEDTDDDHEDAVGETVSTVLKLGAGATATREIGGDEDTDYTDYQFLDDDGYENGEYKCGVCDRAFANSQETKYHMVNHVQGFVCPMPACGFQYDQFVRFSLHMANKHINSATQRCGHCGAEHRTFDELQAHIKNDCVERKFACEGHCDKKFFSRKAMNQHRTWSRGKRFICKYCDKPFAQQGELTIHMRMHTQERPYVCTVCGKSYKTSSMRASHMDTHIVGKTFTCNICGKAMQTRTCYRTHLKRHTAEKKHECSYCQKRFHTRYHINQHIAKVHEKGAANAVASTTETTMRPEHLDDDDDDDPLGMDLME